MSPRTHEPSVPPALEAVVLRLLEKDPARRYQSAKDVVEALNQAALRFSGEQDAPEPSLKLSGIYRRPNSSARSNSSPAFTDATTINTTGGDLGSLLSVDRERPGAVRRIWPWLVGGSLAAAAGALATMLIAGQRQEQADAEAAKEQAAALPPVAAPAPVPVSPPTTVEPAPPVEDPIVRELEAAPVEVTVRLLVASKPAGAVVYRESDGVRLGKTPLEVRARKGRGEAVFILRRNGFRTERLAIPVHEDQDRTVALRRGMATPPPVARRGVVTPPEDVDSTTPPPQAAAGAADAEPGEDKHTGSDRKDGGATGKTDDKPAGEGARTDGEPKRGKDDALDPFNLLRPPAAKKTDKKRDKKPTDQVGEGQDGARDGEAQPDESEPPKPPNADEE
jgi:hypothetical protein